MLRPRPDCHTRQLCVRMLTGNVDVEFIAGNPVGKRGTAYGKRRPGFLACIHLAVACRRGIRLLYIIPFHLGIATGIDFYNLRCQAFFRAMLGMVAFQDGDFRPLLGYHQHPSRHQQRESGIQDFNNLHRPSGTHPLGHMNQHAVLRQKGVQCRSRIGNTGGLPVIPPDHIRHR